MAPREPEQLSLLYEIARSRLDKQLDFLDSLDTKLGLFLSVGAAILTVAGAVVTVDHARWSLWAGLALAVSASAFIGLAFWTLIPLRLQRWGTGPRVGQIALVQLRGGESEATKAAINTMIALHAENEPAYKAKGDAILPAAIALALEALAAVAALALVAGR